MSQAKSHAAAVRALKKKDSVLAGVISQIGPCQLKRRGGTFELIARSILSQQISVAAARTIRRRLEDLLPGRRITPDGYAALTEQQLAAIGISRQKRGYLGDLCQKVLSGEVNFRRLARLRDEHVIEELTQVKGIGVWTAQMFLLAGLGRPDVFAPDDLGLQNAMKRLYGDHLTTRDDFLQLASVWQPHRSVACWYLWQWLDS